MKTQKIYPEILNDQISELPYFRAFLRAVEARYYQPLELEEPVFDLGAGDGHFAARTFQKKLDIGYDPAFGSLQEARTFDAYRLLVNGLGDCLPVKDGSFSTVVSNSVLEHIPDVDAVIREMYRILKPSGRLLITVPNSNFTQNLSNARLLERLGLKKAADSYRVLFNKISRHYHPDPADVWRGRLETVGFKIEDQWSYFPPESLKILEWGHLFGIPNWINKQIFRRWVLFPNFCYNRTIYRWIYRHYAHEQESSEGAYTFFIARKK
jgi:SAM-dependent methyltransferase